jgi:hypothetical protein
MNLMMQGMTAKNFDPVRYSGRWFEVASLKRGFAGQGQEDCHCTQVKSNLSEFCCWYFTGHGWYLPGSGIYQNYYCFWETGMVSNHMK